MDANDILAACGLGTFVTLICFGVIAVWNMFYYAMENFWWRLWK